MTINTLASAKPIVWRVNYFTKCTLLLFLQQWVCIKFRQKILHRLLRLHTNHWPLYKSYRPLFNRMYWFCVFSMTQHTLMHQLVNILYLFVCLPCQIFLCMCSRLDGPIISFSDVTARSQILWCAMLRTPIAPILVHSTLLTSNPFVLSCAACGQPIST